MSDTAQLAAMRMMLEMMGETSILRSPAFREVGKAMNGAVGEMDVAMIGKQLGVPGIHDLYLPIGEDVTQIDHIFCLGHALVVVETKNWNGLVFGSADDRHWTLAGRGGRRTRMYNPILQNKTHVAALHSFAGDMQTFQGVVMTGNASFPKGKPEGVISLQSLASFLQSNKQLDGAAPEFVRMWNSLHEFQRNSDPAEMRRRHARTLEKAKRSGS
jgi:hypothetical protein